MKATLISVRLSSFSALKENVTMPCNSGWGLAMKHDVNARHFPGPGANLSLQPHLKIALE